MEIEAKFVLPTIETFHRCQTIENLAGYDLSTARVKQVRDTYMDTAERRIMAAGYACRQREQNEKVLLTLKGLGIADGAVHRREEIETELSGPLPFSQWPASPVRDRARKMIGDAPLTPLFVLRQTRMIRTVNQGERQVAELSLDEVHLAVKEKKQTYFEMEVELSPHGTENDLTAIVNYLQSEWNLKPETRSKFERGLSFLEESFMENSLLTPQERTLCEQIATRDDMYRRRALALLTLDEGTTQAEAGERAKLSTRRVRYWLAEFRERRLTVFPDRVLEQQQTPTRPRPTPPETPSSFPLGTFFDRC